jgi:F-type H+-transporting ATPase subunit epsilon
VTLNVALVAPEGEVWTGEARQIIAKTLDGDIGILAGHTPVLGILAEGSLVRIFPEDGSGEVAAAIGGGFLSVADDQVSVLARQALLGQDVDKASARSALESAQSEAGSEETTEIRFLRAQLRAAGDQA